jgi:hypothetical protein
MACPSFSTRQRPLQFIKNAYIQILSMHEKKKVKKKSIKTHHQYAEKNVPLCMLY